MDVERKTRHVVDSLLQSQHFKGEKQQPKKTPIAGWVLLS
jgi:hypothetical protein